MKKTYFGQPARWTSDRRAGLEGTVGRVEKDPRSRPGCLPFQLGLLAIIARRRFATPGPASGDTAGC